MEINLKLPIEAVNHILSVLGERPFREVYQLVATIQQQTLPQTQATTTPAETWDEVPVTPVKEKTNGSDSPNS